MRGIWNKSLHSGAGREPVEQGIYQRQFNRVKLPRSHIFYAEFGFGSGNGRINIKKSRQKNGNKLRYYLQPFFTERLKKYQEIYVREHDFQKFCKKFPNGSDEVCQKCIEKYKIPKGFPAMICPTYPLYSDSVTKVLSYEDLFAVNAAEKSERDEKAMAVRLEKEFAERKSAKEKSKKVNLSKEKILEEQKSDENIEPTEERREIAEVAGENQSEVTEDVGTDGENLGGQAGASEAEKSKSEIIEEKIGEKILSEFYFGEENSKIALFGESLSDLREYEESWEKYINGD